MVTTYTMKNMKRIKVSQDKSFDTLQCFYTFHRQYNLAFNQ